MSSSRHATRCDRRETNPALPLGPQSNSKAAHDSCCLPEATDPCLQRTLPVREARLWVELTLGDVARGHGARARSPIAHCAEYDLVTARKKCCFRKYHQYKALPLWPRILNQGWFERTRWCPSAPLIGGLRNSFMGARKSWLSVHRLSETLLERRLINPDPAREGLKSLVPPNLLVSLAWSMSWKILL